MSKDLNNLKEKIFGNKKEYTPLGTWHYLMLNYGWIPLEEFLSLDASTTDFLVIELNKRNKAKPRKAKRIKK